jgi:hypothetical protein
MKRGATRRARAIHTSALISPRVPRGSYTRRRPCCVYVRFSRSLPKLPAPPPGQPRIPYQMQVQTYGNSRAFSATARGCESQIKGDKALCRQKH